MRRAEDFSVAGKIRMTESVYNGNFLMIRGLKSPSAMPILADSVMNSSIGLAQYPAMRTTESGSANGLVKGHARHNKKINIGCMDGHVQALSAEEYLSFVDRSAMLEENGESHIRYVFTEGGVEISGR